MTLPAFRRDLRLSPNFTIAEFVSANDSQGWNQLQANWQTVGPKLLTLAVHILQPLREKFGEPVRITSGYRSPSHNRKIGGASASRHMVGDAADVWIDGVPLAEVQAFLRTLPHVGGLAIRPGQFVHVDARPRVGGRIVEWTY